MPSLWITGPDGTTLIPLDAEGYASEKDFQKLLAENPAVLVGALGDEAEASQWLLVDRELPIKAEESGTGTWSLDHLFVASDGTPVLVEVKRSGDPRARREVVAQMLDYAASFAYDWSAERLRARWEQRTLAGGLDEMESVLATGGFEEESEFWREVQTRIDAGRIRLLFVADSLSSTLVRIIEYLNGQLRNAEVLGVEVVRHASAADGPVAYQPVVRGRSTEAAMRKAPSRRITSDEFDEFVMTHEGKGMLEALHLLTDKVSQLGGFPSFGTSIKNPALYLNFHTNGGNPVYWPLLARPGAQDKLVVRIQKLKSHPGVRRRDRSRRTPREGCSSGRYLNARKRSRCTMGATLVADPTWSN